MTDLKKKSTLGKALIVVALLAAVAAAMVARNAERPGEVDPQKPGKATANTTKSSGGLPRMVDLGATKCVPCKMMKPILEDLQKNYADRFEVVFIDVWENPAAGKEHGVRMIPTQIFYDAAGQELSRHEGFMSKEDILKTWKELGVEVGASN